MRSYGIEVMHVSTDDHGEWRVNTMTEDGDISTTGTFYVTVAQSPSAISIHCPDDGGDMDNCEDQVTHKYFI